MKSVSFAFAALLTTAAALQGCGPAPSQPRDVGNMAYPAPLPQGNVSTTAPGTATSVGNMQYPAPLPQGNVTTTTGRPGVRDTGSMAYPAPATPGVTTTVKP
jgi:hypothetical protein